MGWEMLLNNIELDLKTRFIEENTTQTEVAEKMGVSLSYVNRITKGREQIINKAFVRMLDELGYDVEITGFNWYDGKVRRSRYVSTYG